MAKQTVKMTIQLRRDTAANWELYKDIVPATGEPCFVLDKNILKIGDGVTTFEKLEPINGVKLNTDGKSIVLEDNVFKLAGFDAAEVGAQPRVAADGSLEWVMAPTIEVVDALQSAVTTLQNEVKILKNDVTDLRSIIGASESGSDTLLSRVEGLEKEVTTLISGLTPDGKINTMMELIEYVETYGEEAAAMASNIMNLQKLVGNDPVADQILYAIEASEKKSEALYEKVKYEITNTPVGALVDYRDKEIRVMCPANTKFELQNVGTGGNGNMYYMGFKAYAPDGAVSFKEGDQGVIVDEMFDFNGDFAGTDEYGRNYSICWLALATYDGNTDTWTYFGKNSTVNKYIGWTYCVEWYDANGVVISSDKIRINLSNESCHDVIEPYYMAGLVKEVAVNGTLLDIVNGRVDIAVEDVVDVKGSDEITIAEDGTLGIGKISFSKIVPDEDEEIILNGGGAAG